MMHITPWGLEVIKAFEGFRAMPYYCPAGVLTQGYGHTAAAGGELIGGAWTKEKAEKVLLDDLRRNYIPAVWKLIKANATPHQFDALVSFAYNCGTAALKKSSLLKHHNRGNYAAAAGAFAAWRNVRGAPNNGLIRRRATEALAYQGIKDLNFNGKNDGEPIYGAMPQKIDKPRQKLSKSRTARGSTAGMGAGALILSKQAQAALEEAQTQISTGTWIGLALGCVVLGTAAYAFYAAWDDAGRWKPRFMER